MNFQAISENIVKDYLGTVAYVDDQIFMKEWEPKPEQVKSPTRETIAKAKEDEDESFVKTSKESVPNFNPNELTRSFSKFSIHCALLQVDEKKNESIKNTLVQSDAVILDWKMYGNSGSQALEFIEHILKHDTNAGSPLRLIIIYTNEKNFQELIEDNINPVVQKLSLPIDEQTKYCIVSGHTKIVVLSKFKGVDESQYVIETELANRIIHELTELTSGLVSNTALKAVTVIRRNTHKLLGLFRKNLDAAYLSHRAMLPVPSDAEDHLLEVISNNVHSILDYSDIRSCFGVEAINEWVENKNLESNNPINIGGNKNIILDKYFIKTWLKIGLEKAILDNSEDTLTKSALDKRIKKVYQDCINYFLEKGQSPEGLHEKLAILILHKSNVVPSEYRPKLTLGTVIKGKKSNQYLICIQQKCDAVRITDGYRRFLFLKLEINNEKFDYVLTEGDNYIKLKAKLKSYNIKTIKFKPNKYGAVMSRKYGRGPFSYFTPIYQKGHPSFNPKTDEKYIWLFDLKEAFAQKLANEYANTISRVAVDHSEWLRRSKKWNV